MAAKNWLITIKGKTTKSASQGFSYAKMGREMEKTLLRIKLIKENAREEIKKAKEITKDTTEEQEPKIVAVEDKDAKERKFNDKPSENKGYLFESIKNIEIKEDDITIIGILNKSSLGEDYRLAKWDALEALENVFGVTDQSLIAEIESRGMLAVSYFTSGEVEEK